ncbi:MAG: sce7725 family protein [Sphingobacteriales bacterium]
MYFPYLRGKQFELLALRELAHLPLIGEKVSPVIEPLKLDTRAIITMVRSLPPSIRIHLIINPEHGEIRNGSRVIADLIRTLRQANYVNVTPTFIISANRDLILLQQVLEEYGFNESGYSLIHLNQIAGVTALSELVARTNCLYNIIQVSHIIALRRNFPRPSLAFIADPFNRQLKNADYLHVDDENFSTDHQYYQDEGFVGFGDYLTIGSTFIDGGRLPWAVVIHLTYEDHETRNVRIHHFVSDSNEDDSDTAGKFAEALDKLIVFVNERGIESMAISAFQDLHARGGYPGLGTIKKLSIMHHIELIQSLI